MKKLISGILGLILLVNIFNNNMLIYAATDEVGPIVSDMTITPDKVDMGEYVKVSARIKDDSGVKL